MKRIIKSFKTNIVGIIFWIVILSVFIVISSFLIIRASGYAYNANAKKFQKTGLIYLRTYSKDAEIYLDGELKAFQTPKRFSYLLPGSYTIKIKKSGYQTITKRIKVYEGLVTAYSNILLFNQSPKSEAINNSKISDFILSPGKSRIFFQNKNGFEIIDLNKKTSKKNLNFSNLDNSAPVKLFDWTNNSYIIAENKQEIFILDLNNNTAIHPLGQIPDISKIEIQNNNQALILAGDKLYRFTLDNLRADLISENVGNFILDGQNTYYLKKKTDGVSLILDSTLGERELFTTNKVSPDSQILVAPDNQIAILDATSSKLYYFNGEKNNLLILSSFTNNAVWSSSREIFNFREKYKLLYSSENEIWLFQKNAKNIFGEPEEKRLITRFDSKVLSLGFFRYSNYFFYQLSSDIFTLDNDGASTNIGKDEIIKFDFDRNFQNIYTLEKNGLLFRTKIR